MKLTYTIQVCNESRELYSLLNFLSKTTDDEDEINVVVDANRITDRVESVLEHFKERITVFKRPFDNFYLNSQFHADKATGEYAFLIDVQGSTSSAKVKKALALARKTSVNIRVCGSYPCRSAYNS